jgi:hypothetical protein
MNLLHKQFRGLPVGSLIAFSALILISLAWIMQLYSLFNWEAAVKLGLQNGSFSGNEAEKIMANKEKGEAIADLIWPMPITLVAMFRILKKRFIGFVASMMVFAICVYFPLFYIFQLWDSHRETATAATLLWGIPSVLGMIGLWANRRIYMPDADQRFKKT